MNRVQVKCFSKNKDEKLYPASTTKVLTALLAIEYGDLNEIVTVGNEANLAPKDSSLACEILKKGSL